MRSERKQSSLWTPQSNVVVTAGLLLLLLLLLLLSVGLPAANAPDVLLPCGLLYYP